MRTQQQCEIEVMRLQKQIIALQQENNALRADLQRTRIQQALLQAEQERAAELAKANEVLARASERLVAQPDLSAFLSHIALEASAQLNADAAMLSILDEHRQVLKAVAHVEQNRIPVSTLAAEMPMSEVGFVHLLLETRKPRYFDLQQEAHLFWGGSIEYHRRCNHQAVIGVPLFAGGTFLGHLGLAFTHKEPIKEQSSELLYALAQQAALAIQLTKLADEAKQAAIAREQEQAARERAAELAKANEPLRRSLERLANDRHLDSFLAHVLQEAMQILDGASAQIFLYEPESDTLVSSVGIDRQGEVFPAPGLMQELPIDRPFPANITGGWQRLLNSRGPIHFDIDRDAEDFWPGTIEWHRSQGHHGSVCVAMMMGDRPLGMLGLAFRGRTEFTAAEFEFVQALGQQATLAIQLTRLAEEVKQAAIAREQEKAAQASATELARANQALQLSLGKLADEPDLQRFLGHILIVCAEQFGAIGAGIWQYEDELSYLLVSYEAGTIHLPLELAHADAPRALKQMREDPDIYDRLTCGEIVTQTEEDLQTRSVYQPYQAELEEGRIRSLLLIPICIGQSLRGSLVLRFDCPYILKTEAAGLAHALANQAALALELTRLAEEAQQATLLEERNRMARELHDSLAQSLTGIIMHQEAIRQQSSSTFTLEREIQDHVNWTLTLAREGLQAARRSVHALRSDTTQLKLQNALETLAAQMSHNFPIEAIVSVRGASYPLSNEVTNHLLRIGQEALTNTIKHAVADRVHIELIFEPTQVRLRIQDNGQGFIAKPVASSGFGLLGMQERAERLGGFLTITSQPAKGTEVAIAVPIP